MLKVASWIRPKDVPPFQRAFAAHPEVEFWNAAERAVPLEEMDGLLLTGGPDVSAEFLRQEIPDPSVLDTDVDPVRDAWEFAAAKYALEHDLPILAICKGHQLLNVALDGTLRLDIPGHNAPEQRDENVQPLRTERAARHRFEKVNSAHHQAIDRLGDGLVVEAWSADDDIIEQVRLTSHPFVVGVQYHPERSPGYETLFADFVAQLQTR